VTVKSGIFPTRSSKASASPHSEWRRAWTAGPS